MNKTEIITYSAIVLMILFLIIAFVTSDVTTSKLMASFGIITGAFTSHQVSKSNKL